MPELYVFSTTCVVKNHNLISKATCAGRECQVTRMCVRVMLAEATTVAAINASLNVAVDHIQREILQYIVVVVHVDSIS